MIETIQNYYNAPSPCLDLCTPLQKYQEFFVSQNEEATGFSKIALTIAWIATGFFAYPIFGLLAAVGVAIKIATGQQAGVDPIDMTAEELQVWGQDPSVTTERWNEVQSKKLERFLDEIASSKGNLPASGTYYGGPRVDPEPWDQAGIWWGDNVYLGCFPIKDGDAFEETLESIKANKEAVPEGLKNEKNRIEVRYMYRLGGEPEIKGMVFVDVRKVAEVTASNLLLEEGSAEVVPVDMSEEQLEVWGQGDAVTTADWNAVQVQRAARFLDNGLRLASQQQLHASPMFSGEVSELNPWNAGQCWDGAHIFNRAVWFNLDDSVGRVKKELLGTLTKSAEQDHRLAFRCMYQVGGVFDLDNKGIAFISCQKLNNESVL